MRTGRQTVRPHAELAEDARRIETEVDQNRDGAGDVRVEAKSTGPTGEVCTARATFL